MTKGLMKRIGLKAFDIVDNLHVYQEVHGNFVKQIFKTHK